MIPEIALPGGAILLEEAAEEARSFAVGFWFPLGSRHEAAAERGFVHFVEHMVFKGSARRSAQDFAREVDRVGGYLNAFTERDTLCFHCTLPARHWRLALDILVDLVFNASFPEAEFLREQTVIKSEILAARDDPEEASHDAFLERIWPGHPLSLKIAGETSDIDAATRDSLYAFYRRRLRPSHLVVSASGPVNEAEVAEELARLLDALPAYEGRSEVYPAEDLPAFMLFHDFAPASISQVYLYEAVQLAGTTGADDYYVLSVLNGAVGESMSSRLFQSLREKEGLCYSVYSGFSVDRGLGLWLAGASASPRLFPKLLAGLDRELDRLAQGGEGALSAEEVSESVSRVAGSFELALDDPEYRMRRLAKQKICNGFVLDAGETMRKILEVDKPAVDAMAARLFSARPRSRFAYGRKSPRSIAALIEAGLRDAKGKTNG
jgi:predicted Zn-dependent peptidase